VNPKEIPMAITLLIRHSNRQHIRTAADVTGAGITVKGYLNAFRAGRFLGNNYKIDGIYTSHIGRCYDTARAIAFAYSPLKVLPVTREKSAYDTICGGFVKEGMFDEWNRIGVENGFHKKFYDDTRGVFALCYKSGIMKYESVDGYAKEFLGKYLNGKSLLIVGHDTTIVPIWMHLGTRFGFDANYYKETPPILTGIAIEHDDGEIYAVSRIDTLGGKVDALFSKR
jgi:broad specificity phosphatase PhoE